MKRSLSTNKPHLSNETKDVLGALFVELHRNGLSVGSFTAALNSGGYDIHESTVNRWAARTRSGHPAINDNKKTGRKELLDAQQQEIMTGWVIEQNHSGVEVHLNNFREAASQFFSVDMQDSAASSYLL